MKKLFIVAALCAGTFTVANAQYSPEKGDFAVELGFTPFNTTGGETFKLNEGMLKARYFLNDKNALRLKIGLGIDNTEEKANSFYDPYDKSGTYDKLNGNMTITNKHTDFSFMLGYEHHLFTEGRFDVYAGLELGYGMSKYSGSESMESDEYEYSPTGRLLEHSYKNESWDYINTDTDGENVSSKYFAGNLFAGVDVYVWKNLYLGAEFGLAFKTGKSPNYYCNGNLYAATYNTNGDRTSYYSIVCDGETNTIKAEVFPKNIDVPDGVFDAPSISNEKSETSFKFFVEPAIRIGWKF